MNQSKPRILISGPIFNTPSGPSGQGGKLFSKLQEEGYTVFRRSSYRNKILRVFDTLWFVVFHSRKYDVIIIQMFSNMAFLIDFFTVNISKLMGKKVITVIRGGAFVEFYDKFPRFVGGVLKKCDFVISPSLFIKSHLENKRIRVRTIPNFIETERFPFEWKPENGHKLLWVRAFTTIYKPWMAIRLVERLKSQFPDIHLTMVGPDMGLQQEMKSLIDSLGLKSNITLTGPVPNHELSKYYTTHTVYINTTTYESFGVALIEAACSGIPIVTTRVGEIPYMWEDTKDMLMVEDNDDAAFAECVGRLLNNQAERHGLSQNAHNKAINFNWNTIKGQWEELFDQIG